jgi:hypothetical protein
MKLYEPSLDVRKHADELEVHTGNRPRLDFQLSRHNGIGRWKHLLGAGAAREVTLPKKRVNIEV